MGKRFAGHLILCGCPHLGTDAGVGFLAAASAAGMGTLSTLARFGEGAGSWADTCDEAAAIGLRRPLVLANRCKFP